MPANARPRSKHRNRKQTRKRKMARDACADAATPRGPTLGQVIDSVVPQFRDFYSASGLKLSDREWVQLIRSLRDNLPISFRICDRKSLPSLPPNVAALTRFIPAVDAFCFAVDARTLRTAHAEVQSWLVDATTRKLISRQEVVSMLPVSLLEIGPTHTVLDLCASPGSKTSQAAEQAAFVVANELSHSRSHTLANRSRRANVVVVNHKAQTVPAACLFDRIICDVPCSGDGTFRKYPDKWGKWEASVGRQLHSLQIQIAMRGARLLKKGGLMAYSTCSVNPLENEAVVQSILKRTDGALVLVHKRVQDFHTRPGITSWNVISEDLTGVEQTNKSTSRVRASMFPDEHCDELEKCIRVYPHDNDTGGFFIAILKKVKTWPETPDTVEAKTRAEYTVEDSKLSFTPNNQFTVSPQLGDFLSGPGRYFNIVSAGVPVDI